MPPQLLCASQAARAGILAHGRAASTYTRSSRYAFTTPRLASTICRGAQRSEWPIRGLGVNTSSMSPFTQTRAHSHHHHHHDTTYLTSTNKADAGVRITRIGLYSNLGMAVAKGIGGYVFNSQSMIADAYHSLTDLASDILTLATFSWSLRPPTDSFPSGFGKVESLGSLGVSGMLLLGGCFMCLNSCEILYAHWFYDAQAAMDMAAHAHGHSHGHGLEGAPSLHAAWLAAGTVVVKEWLYQSTIKIAKERKSSVLASNAVHHRVDSLTGIVTLLAILGSNFLHNAAWLDPIGGLLISLLVIKAGFGNTLSAVYELADKGIDHEMKDAVTKAVTETLTSSAMTNQIVATSSSSSSTSSSSSPSSASPLRLLEVEGVKSGQNYLIELLIAAPPTWDLGRLRGVETALRHAVGERVRGVRRVKIRFVSADDEAPTLFDEFVEKSSSGEASGQVESAGAVGGSAANAARNGASMPLEQVRGHHEHGPAHGHEHEHDGASRSPRGGKGDVDVQVASIGREAK